jgi:hypothetical protein
MPISCLLTHLFSERGELLSLRDGKKIGCSSHIDGEFVIGAGSEERWIKEGE